MRVVILTGEGKHFTSGLDLVDFGTMMGNTDSTDVGRKAVYFHELIDKMQKDMSAAENCRVPVIAAMHGYVIGAGVDLSSACDIRLCTKDSKFSVREVDIGMAADVGTLQRFPKVVGNQSWVREVCLTGRMFDGEEALTQGYVSHIYENADELEVNALKLATELVAKSPIAIYGTKKTLIYSRDHGVPDGLN